MSAADATAHPSPRDYSLLGKEAKVAEELGLKSAEWYHSDVSRKEMKELMKRSDGPAIRDTIIWLGLMVIFAGLAIWLWPSWWAALPLAAYGALSFGQFLAGLIHRKAANTSESDAKANEDVAT